MKKNHHLHRLVRLCLIISLLLLCSTSQVFAAAKVNVKNTKIKLSATKLTYNQKAQRPKVPTLSRLLEKVLIPAK